MSIEVEEGRYLFLPKAQPNLEEDSDETSDKDAIQSPMDAPKRVFLHNPLHDYESIWWIAVWLVICSKPKGVDNGVMEEVYNQVYKNRVATFWVGGFGYMCNSLPVVLQPLGKVLEKMLNTLVVAYESFESSFDGSKMLFVFQKMKKCLLLLEREAQGLAIMPPIHYQKLNAEEGGN